MGKLTSTHTYAELAVSQATYNEIGQKLRDADYEHAFMSDGTINMHGIGLVVETLDVGVLSLEGATAVMKTLADVHGKPYAQQKAAVQIVFRDLLTKCQTK